MKDKYTPEDVERLVEKAEYLYNNNESWDRVSREFGGWAAMKDLGEALVPFRPDPDEELIEAMTKAYRSARNLNVPSEFPHTADAMRAVLAVIKEKGYFNDQR